MTPIPFSQIIICPIPYTVVFVALLAAILTIATPFSVDASVVAEREQEFLVTASNITGSQSEFDEYRARVEAKAPILAIERLAGIANFPSATTVPMPHPELRCVGCFHETF